jgi:hypothetical protein
VAKVTLASRGHFRVCLSSWGETGLLTRVSSNGNPRNSGEPSTNFHQSFDSEHPVSDPFYIDVHGSIFYSSLADSDEGCMDVELTISDLKRLIRLVLIENLNEDASELGMRYLRPL